MDTQAVLDTALAANATALGNGPATEFFREAVRGSYKVAINLKPPERDYLRRMVPFPVVFTNTNAMASDHAVIAACRELARAVYERCFGVLHTTERTLVVGAAMREISMYNANPHIHYYVHGGEAKDVDRIVRPALLAISSRLKSKAAKSDKRVYMPHAKTKNQAARGVAKRYEDFMQILRDYTESHQLPPNIHAEPVQANTLLFEDTIYNFDREALVDIFNKTGAQTAYGYALMPMELLFPDLPDNRLYVFANEGEYSRLTYRGGSSNGYRHKTKAWRLLYDNPVIKCRGTYIVTEIVCRIGPMVVFKLMRARHAETIVRTVALTESESFVKILDLPNMHDTETGKLNLPLKYISVREEEFLDAVNYMMSVDVKSRTLVNCMSYVRRRMGGMSLVARELVAPWDLPKKHVLTFTLAVTAWVTLQLGEVGKYADPNNYDFATWWESCKARLRSWCRLTLRDRFEVLFSLLCQHRISEELVLTPNNEKLQYGDVMARRVAWDFDPMQPGDDPRKGEVPRTEVSAGLYLDHPNEEDLPACDTCLAMHGKLGAQVVVCHQKEDTWHEFSLSEDQLSTLRGSLLQTDEVASGLASVMKRAYEAMPTRPFTQRCRVHYLRAGPGCGKSYVIRLLADENDLVVAPFAKLKPDYENLKGPNGNLYNLTFKTTHRAMETRGHARIFVDEFTSLSYDVLACVAFANAATDIFLVGDDKQSCVQEPTEGLYIGNYINLTSLSTHDLTVNFRNPPDTVALLNKMFGYKMRAAKSPTGEPSIIFTTQADASIPATALSMCFSKMAALKITEDSKNTVRANQGGTYPVVRLNVVADDGTTPEVSALQVVALSRHSEKLYVVCDDSPTATKFAATFDLGTDWKTEYQEFLKISDETAAKVDYSDEVITRVLGHADSDAACTTASDTELAAKPREGSPTEKSKTSLGAFLAGLSARREPPVSSSDSETDVRETETRNRRAAFNKARVAGLRAIARGAPMPTLQEETTGPTVPDFGRTDLTMAQRVAQRFAMPPLPTPRRENPMTELARLMTNFPGADGLAPPSSAVPATLRAQLNAPVEIRAEVSDSGVSEERESETRTASPVEGTPASSDEGVVLAPSMSADDPERAEQSEEDPEVREVVSRMLQSIAGCQCATLRDVALTDGFRVHPPDTARKIDQIIPFLMAFAEIPSGEKSLCILGGAPREGARVVPMATETVREEFRTWWSVDPRFEDGGTSTISARFQDVAISDTDVFFSDMWVPGSDSKNNMLGEVVEWYAGYAEDERWKNFALVHKLTWSTTNTVDLAANLGKFAKWRLLRVVASGASSEMFLVVVGLRPRDRWADANCCSVAHRVNDLLAHAQSCEDCLNGRLVRTVQPFTKLTPWEDVLTNCKTLGGGPIKSWETARDAYRRSGKGPDKGEPRAKGQRDDFGDRWPKLTPHGVSSGSGGYVAHSYDWPIQAASRLDAPDPIVACTPREAEEYLAENPDFAEHAQTWLHHTRLGLRDYDRLPWETPVATLMPQTSRDPHLLAGELLSVAATSEEVTSWNWFQSQLVRGKFGTGRMSVDAVICPLNQRKHLLSLEERYYSAGPGMGLHFSAKKPCQVLAVMETRYLNIRKGFPFGYKEILLAREIVDLWFDEHVLPAEERPPFFTEEDIDRAMNAYLTDAKRKGYATRYAATGSDDGPEGRMVRFHLKSIFKPKLTPDLYKVGQGISAWSVQTLAMYCSVFRLLTGATLRVEKPYVVTDAYWSEREFVQYINTQMKAVPSVAPFGVTDGEMFDACQNAFTQELEKHYLRRLGLSVEIIEHYYSFRAGYFLKAACVEGRAGTQKTSGEPGTLYNNGSVAKMISNWLLRGDGPKVIIYKGDDFVKRQCNLWVDEERRRLLDTVCALKIRVNISNGAEFCGLVLEQGFMFPSIVRKLNKATSHRFRSYEHFCEYQAALRDWVENVYHFGAEMVVGHNADMYDTSYDHINSMLEAIRGLSHINQEQFETSFGFCREPATIPVMSRETGRIVMIEV